MVESREGLKIQKFAQKAIVINDKNQILLIKYGDAKYRGDTVSGKYALPGGKIEFGETPDESTINEVLQETGVTCKPGLCIDTWNWEYQKDEDLIQINAVSRVCKYVSGELLSSKKDKETNIDACEWVNIEDLANYEFVLIEKPSIDKFIENKDFYLSSLTKL